MLLSRRLAPALSLLSVGARRAVGTAAAAVDMRSDTVTRPSSGMLDAMRAAPVGDDVYGEDPTVNELERRFAQLCGKPAALFVASGTMGNLVSIAAHCNRGDELILGTRSHIFLHEAGSPAALLGVTPYPIANAPDGTLPLEAVAAAVRDPDDAHYPRSRLLCVENTQNECGGVPLPPAYLRDARAACDAAGLALHVDGARLFNAAAALGRSVGDLLEAADSASMCLSKGLGCPVGSVVVGSADFIAKCRRMRKALGGGMRQCGGLAAAGLFALEHNAPRLRDDHARAARLAAALAALPGVEVQGWRGSEQASAFTLTNLVWFTISASRGLSPQQVEQGLAQRGVLISGGYEGPRTLRFRAATHLHVTDACVDRAIAAFRAVLGGEPA